MAQGGGHVEIRLRFSNVTKELQVARSIASFPCAVKIPRKECNHDAEWLTQPKVGRSKQESVVAVDIGHNPAWTDSIVDELQDDSECWSAASTAKALPYNPITAQFQERLQRKPTQSTRWY